MLVDDLDAHAGGKPDLRQCGSIENSRLLHHLYNSRNPSLLTAETRWEGGLRRRMPGGAYIPTTRKGIF